jgi:uncharacterized membrane protein YbhN (UPF0104 family)
MLKTIQRRLSAPESKIGRFLVRVVGVITLAISAIGASLDYIHAIPHDWFPEWVKITIVICGVLSVVIGKLTVHPDYEKPKPPSAQ